MRTFLAIPVPVMPGVARAIDELAAIGSFIRPVRARQLHLTLKFLGKTPREQVDSIMKVVADTVETSSPIELRLFGAAAFPNGDQPSVVWAGVSDSDPITRLATDLERRLTEFGFPVEKRTFTPHVTLARIRRPRPGRGRRKTPQPDTSPVTEWIARHSESDFGTWKFDLVALYRSELDGNGPVYTVMQDVRVGGS